MVSASTDVLDAFVLSNIDQRDQNKYQTYCSINGGITLTTEMMAYFYLFSYSYVMKKKITSLTSSIKQIILMVHSFSIIIPIFTYFSVVLVQDGFGPSVSFNAH